MVHVQLCIAIIYSLTGCITAITHHAFDMNRYRLSDSDFQAMFSNAEVMESKIRCVVVCIHSVTSITYYDDVTGRCVCQSESYAGDVITTGSNYMSQYVSLGKMQNNLTARC